MQLNAQYFDVMDEVGARVHISNINVPADIVALENQIELVKKEKNQVVKSQKYEEAAQLRDREKKLIDQLEKAKAVKISLEKNVKIVQDIAAKASQDVKDAIVQLEHANVILEIKYNASSEAEYLSTQAKHFANVFVY